MSFEDIYSADLLNKKRERVKGQDVLKQKLILLHFSAHWCPPAREFTATFARWYNDLVSKKKRIACVYISSDRSEKSTWAYFAAEHGDYHCLPFGHKLRDIIHDVYKVRHLPTILVLQEDGGIIENNGREAIEKNEPDTFEKWFGKKNNLASVTFDGVDQNREEDDNEEEEDG